jgi:hypothetical protein
MKYMHQHGFEHEKAAEIAYKVYMAGDKKSTGSIPRVSF